MANNYLVSFNDKLLHRCIPVVLDLPWQYHKPSSFECELNTDSCLGGHSDLSILGYPHSLLLVRLSNQPIHSLRHLACLRVPDYPSKLLAHHRLPFAIRLVCALRFGSHNRLAADRNQQSQQCYFLKLSFPTFPDQDSSNLHLLCLHLRIKTKRWLLATHLISTDTRA